ncbi:hypothetical protein AB0425_17265 [Actinosynnema sp. NPDC051121]
MAVLHPAPTDLKPYYLRDQTGQYTGDEFDTEQEALAAAAAQPGWRVHRDRYVADNPAEWEFTGPHFTPAPAPPPVTPRWAALSWGDLT